MDFSEALTKLKRGFKLTRAGWNGAGQYLYMVPPADYPAITDIAKNEFGDKVPYGAYIAIKTTQHTVAPWVPSSGDLFAMDWNVVDES